jgi:hypothetical protein
VLTLILLVVFGGAGGLLAVWLIDPDSLTPLTERLRLASLRGDRGQGTTGERPAEPADEAVPEAPTAADPEPEPEPAPEMAVAVAPAGAPPTDLVQAPAGPPKGRRSAKVPAAFTAIEGTYRDVARVPLWRKVLSLVLILVLLVGAGIAFAALLAGGLAVAAGLLDRAIG